MAIETMLLPLAILSMAATPASAMEMMGASEMSMTFFTSTSTPLLSSAWAPSSTGAYAGTCIFLIILAFIFRTLIAGKTWLERRWAAQALQRRYIVVADKNRLSDDVRDGGLDEKDTAVLTVRGREEDVRIAKAPAPGVAPWRFSVDLPRAGLVTVMTGVGYLL